MIKWASSAGGKGLKPFIDRVHAMGLKVGMHTLQGSITAAALHAQSAVLGAKGAIINDVVGPVCSWQPHGFGLDMTKPAAQAFLDSVYAQFGGDRERFAARAWTWKRDHLQRSA